MKKVLENRLPKTDEPSLIKLEDLTNEDRIKEASETLDNGRATQIAIIAREISVAALCLQKRLPELDGAGILNAATAAVLSIRKDKRENGRYGARR